MRERCAGTNSVVVAVRSETKRMKVDSQGELGPTLFAALTHQPATDASLSISLVAGRQQSPLFQFTRVRLL